MALQRLTSAFFSEDTGRPICLVRPQWDYNLSFIPLSSRLRELLSPSVLDPTGKLGLSQENILSKLWTFRGERLGKVDAPSDRPSEHLAILSFAGLDAHDVLLYPLLAHELGHFVDYSHNPPRHLTQEVLKAADLDINEVSRSFELSRGRQLDTREAIEIEKQLRDLINVSLREHLADLIAVRMLGLPFFIAQAEFLKTLVGCWQQLTIVQRRGYPANVVRLRVLFRHLTRSKSLLEPFLSLESESEGWDTEINPWLNIYLGRWESHLSEIEVSSNVGTPTTFERTLTSIVDRAVGKALPSLEAQAIKAIPDIKCATLAPSVVERVRRLKYRLPPFMEGDHANGNSFSETFAAAWIYELMCGEPREHSSPNVGEQYDEYSKTCRLVLKSIELSAPSEAKLSVTSANLVSAVKPKPKQGVLGASEITARAQLSVSDSKYLGIIPFEPSAAKGSSVDVRLGNWFAVARRPLVASVSLDKEDVAYFRMEEIFVRNDENFLIHPGDFVLGATLEFVALPTDLMAFVEGRSRLGRQGLIVATASQIAPGFHGVVVLELANTGTVPLVLKPGISIAQLVFLTMSSPVDEYRGRYDCQIKPLARPNLDLWPRLRGC
ncbi:MAG TPA: dCTP deaminase [Thermoanaerobaculia bacterium]|nr:dCTP deaminase [Thermoanaerobaculia bacterium]